MRRALPFLLAAALIAGPGVVPAAADHEPDDFGCPLHIDETSAENPNIVDPVGDYNGVVTGNEGLAPWGDVYREGTDLTKAWLNRDNDTGDVTGVIEVASLSGPQPNSIFYLLWDFESVEDDPQQRRWVSARWALDRVIFTYGYLGPSVTGGEQFFTLGETTGTVEDGTPGRIVIDVPMAQLGDPQPGAVLSNFAAESRFLTGSPEPLPEPSPLRHGLVQLVDDTENATEFCDAYVNESPDA